MTPTACFQAPLTLLESFLAEQPEEPAASLAPLLLPDGGGNGDDAMSPTFRLPLAATLLLPLLLRPSPPASLRSGDVIPFAGDDVDGVSVGTAAAAAGGGGEILGTGGVDGGVIGLGVFGGRPLRAGFRRLRASYSYKTTGGASVTTTKARQRDKLLLGARSS